MPHRHLTDDEIQNFLDKNGKVPQTAIEAFAESCPCCLKTLKRYQEIYLHMQSEPTPELSLNFADKILARLSEKPQRNPVHRLYTRALYALAIIAVFAVTILFTGLQPLISAFTQFEAPFREIVLSLNGNLHLIIASVLILSLIALVDHGIVRVRKKIT